MGSDIIRLREIYNETLLGAAWFSWYDFPDREHVLAVGDIAESALKELKQKFCQLTVFDSWQACSKVKFSAILVGDGLGNQEANKNFIQECKAHLSMDGVLLWAVDNKLGTRFLCGDSHLGKEKMYYTRRQWEDFFADAGILISNIYYLLPGWHMARMVFTDRCSLSQNNCHRIELHAADPEKIFRDERELLSDIIAGDAFSIMANSFLFEYRLHKDGSAVIYGDMSPDKGRELSSVVLCYENNMVVKKPLYSGGDITNLYSQGEELRRCGLPYIEQKLINGSIVMPYINSPLLSKVMLYKAAEDVNEYRRLWEKFWLCIQKSSMGGSQSDFPIKYGDYGLILAKAYLDMVPTNVFYENDDFLFFDQEYCYENYPAKFVLYRAIIVLYGAEPELEYLVPVEEVKKWFDLDRYWDIFHRVDCDFFIKKVRNFGMHDEFNNKYCPHEQTINRNKQVLLNITRYADMDLFFGTQNKEIILFGSGIYCERFLEKYGANYPVKLIVDNDEKKWHTEKQGIIIESPSILLEKRQGSFIVIICSKFKQEISEQLEQMGIKDYRVF